MTIYIEGNIVFSAEKWKNCGNKRKDERQADVCANYYSACGNKIFCRVYFFTHYSLRIFIIVVTAAETLAASYESVFAFVGTTSL